jgi:hypothetical protein
MDSSLFIKGGIGVRTITLVDKELIREGLTVVLRKQSGKVISLGCIMMIYEQNPAGG